jgi:hypothetical protein
VLDTVFLSSIIYILRGNKKLSPAIGYLHQDEGSAEFDAGGISNGARREPAPFFLVDGMSGAGNITPLVAAPVVCNEARALLVQVGVPGGSEHCSAVDSPAHYST